MKKIFAMMMAAAVAVGCHNDNIVEDIPTTPESEAKTYCDKLTLNVGEETTRVFDDKLVWVWEESDSIIGYQNAGEKSRNTLDFVSENEFACEAFTYSTTDAADFHFFYAKEETEGALTAVQDGTWRPVLVGTAEETTLKEISTVTMEHLSAALEFTLYDENKAATQNIVSARLTSESDFVGCWTVQDDLTYEQTLSGTTIEINNVNKPTVVFNMPTGYFAADALTLTLTTASDVTIIKKLPAQTFEAGQRNRFNVATTAAYLPAGTTFNSAIKSEISYDISKIKFVTNSSATEGTELENGIDTEGDQPIYLVPNGSTLEIHTPASKFVAHEDCYRMFYYLDTITAIDLGSFDTSKVTTMSSMFSDCKALTSLDVSSFDTSNVTKMNSMFSSCKSLTSLDLSNFNTSNVELMAYMFYNCQALASLDVSKFDTSNVTNMASMFYGCQNLASLDVSKFDTSKVTDMAQMFDNCKALTSLDVSNFNTSNVENMTAMFSSCLNLESLDVSEFDTSKLTGMSNMFSDCQKLTSLDVSNFNTSNVAIMKEMFNNCYALTSLDVSNFNTSKVMYMEGMFNQCYALTSLNLSSFDTKNVKRMQSMFSNCMALMSITFGENFDTSNVEYMYSMFYNCQNLASLDVSNFDTSNVTRIDRMFYGCESLTSLDLSSFNTSNVENMESMFHSCKALMSITFGENFDTSEVTSMSNMFYGCETLTLLDVSKFNTSNVTKMDSMFYNCQKLATLDLSSFNTSNVKRMSYMFNSCYALTSITFGENFDTSEVTMMQGMFEFCHKLQNPNLIYNFSFSGDPEVRYMLSNLNSEGEKYNLYVTKEAYDYLTEKGDYGKGNFTLTVKE